MKKIYLILVLFIGVFIISGCTTKKGVTYTVETGDKVKVMLKTNDGYDITATIPFTISENGETRCQGTFITVDGYQQYLNAVNNDSLSKIIKNDTKDNLSYTFYNYNNSEWNYIIKINNSKTGIILGNNISEDTAKECFERISLNVE